jgi:hypothetical protein
MKTILKRISASLLAAVYLAVFAVPRSRAIVGEGFDIVAVANAVVDTHLTALGGEFVIKTGGSSALAAGTESLFTQAGAAGAFGAGVTGATAMGTIAAGVAAFGGGFILGYEGYQVVTQFVEWLKASGKIAAGKTTQIYVSGGDFSKLLDGTDLRAMYGFNGDSGVVYCTQGGSSFWVDAIYHSKEFTVDLDWVFISSQNVVKHFETKQRPLGAWSGDNILKYKMSLGTVNPKTGDGYVHFYFPYLKDGYQSYDLPFEEADRVAYWLDIFVPTPDTTSEKREVTFTSPATWTPPTPTPGQSVLYKPFPSAPDKGLEDIIADVPEAIASSSFKPATTTVIDTPTPEPPPTPDVPPTVNPNPDVQAPEDVTPYTVKIGEVFPFCIPFDLYHMVTMFSAEPEAPNGKWEFYLPWEKQNPHPELYKVEWDLSEFDSLAELCRKLELILFCVGLAVVTSKLIKW